jgi:hypothetical protein
MTQGYCVYNLFPTCENPNHILVTDPNDPGTRFCIDPVTGERGQVGLECPPGTVEGGSLGACIAKPGNNPN